jgi:predicted nuclease of predicted toxin-antitoxin system
MRFRFYANENLTAELVETLRQQGHDVLTSYEAGNANQGIPDDQVLATATAAGRAVLTFNRDDFLALHRSGIDHGGIVVCKDDSHIWELGNVLHDYLAGQRDLTESTIASVAKEPAWFKSTGIYRSRVCPLITLTMAIATTFTNYLGLPNRSLPPG